MLLKGQIWQTVRPLWSWTCDGKIYIDKSYVIPSQELFVIIQVCNKTLKSVILTSKSGILHVVSYDLQQQARNIS